MSDIAGMSSTSSPGLTNGPMALAWSMPSPAGIEKSGLGIDGFYMFSFNQIKGTVAWLNGMLWQLAS